MLTAQTRLPNLYFSATQVDVPEEQWTLGFPGYPDLKTFFGVCYDAGYEAPSTGDYTVVASVDDTVAIWIDGNLVMADNGGTVSTTVEYNTGAPFNDFAPVAAPPVFLTEGTHSVMIQYLQAWPDKLGVQIWIYPPGQTYDGASTPPDSNLMQLTGPPGAS